MTNRAVMLLVIIFQIFYFITKSEGYDNIGVHPYIVEQAYFLWPNDSSHEIYQYLGYGYRDGLGVTMLTMLEACSNAGDGNKITEGAKEEDNYDPIEGKCIIDTTALTDYGFFHHFYEADIAEPNGLCTTNRDPFCLLLPTGSRGALSYAFTGSDNYWNRAKYFYNAGVQANKLGDTLLEIQNKGTAYWYLGRISHLLADMSVPAHVHDDAHIVNSDDYETYTESNYTYTTWNYTDSKTLDITDPINPNWTVIDLFKELAQRAQYFPSDDVGGNTSNLNLDTSTWPDTTAWQSPSDHLDTISSYLLPRAIQYTAALYRLFWREFHPEIVGPNSTGLMEKPLYSVAGKFNGNAITSCEWDFDYTSDNFTPDATGPCAVNTYQFHSWGSRTMAVKVNGNSEIAATKEIYVEPSPIIVTYPNGFEDLSRYFETPSDPAIKSYVWNFGDGTIRTDDDNTTSHTYAASGYYTVKLTITLQDDTSITSEQGIFVGPGTRYIQGHTIYGNETWYSGGTYVVEGQISVAQGATLTIEPETTIKMANGTTILVNGTLKATGVTFTWGDGTNPWNGIHFYGAGTNASRLENCTIEHTRGNMFGCNYWGTYMGAIMIEHASPTITGCTINESTALSGIWMKDASPTISGNNISGFSSAGIAMDSGSCYTSTSSPEVAGNTLSNNGAGISIGNGGGSYQGNTLSGNSVGIIVNYSPPNPQISANTYMNNISADQYVTGDIATAVNWDETGAVVYRLGGLRIAESASLTVASGRMVKFDIGVGLDVSGTLKATGVTFTWGDGTNPWNGIHFYGAGTNASRLENCTIEHTRGNMFGCNYWGTYMGAIMIEHASPTITGCTINESTALSGIWMKDASPTISGNNISGFSSAGIAMDSGSCYTSTSSPEVAGNTLSNNGAGISIGYNDGGNYQGNIFTNNMSYGLHYAGPTLLDARNNNWGDPTGPLDDSDDRVSGGFYNPTGKGNRVSDNVLYYPWAGGASTLPTIPTGLTGAPRYAAASLHWDSTTDPTLGGYKLYYGTTPSTYTTPVILSKTNTHKLTGLTIGQPYYLTLSAMNDVGVESEKSYEITVIPTNQYAVELTIAGTGSGTVLSDPAGIAANVSSAALFDPNTVVNLGSDPAEFSIFSGWTDSCSGTGDCTLTMNADMPVTATFAKDTEHQTRIDATEPRYFPSILGAFTAAVSGETVRAWGTDFAEAVTLTGGKSITFKGGFNEGYTAATGQTNLKGSLTIGNGALTVENLVIW